MVRLSALDEISLQKVLGFRSRIDFSNPTECKQHAKIRTMKHQKYLSEIEVAEILNKHTNGQTIRKLATEYGCHRATISRVLKHEQ